MPDNLPLLIQRLPGFDEQTLVLTHVTTLQTSQDAASPAAIRSAFIALRLPPPANLSQHLRRLRREGFAMQPSSALWSVTPEGVEQIRRLMEGVTDDELTSLGTQPEDPSFGDAPHYLVPFWWAPAKFQEGIARFLYGYPFEKNVFGMSRFPRKDQESDLVLAALDTCRAICGQHALEFHLASDRAVIDDLLGNVVAGMWACRYGILVLEDRLEKGLNYNAIFEAGAMIATGRRCLLLKDSSVENVPTDLVGQIYKSVDFDDLGSVEMAVTEWITADLGLG